LCRHDEPSQVESARRRSDNKSHTRQAGKDRVKNVRPEGLPSLHRSMGSPETWSSRFGISIRDARLALIRRRLGSGRSPRERTHRAHPTMAAASGTSPGPRCALYVDRFPSCLSPTHEYMVPLASDDCFLLSWIPFFDLLMHDTVRARSALIRTKQNYYPSPQPYAFSATRSTHGKCSIATVGGPA